MGVHTGDSITVAPAQTLSDDEYQRMRDAAEFACIRRIGVGDRRSPTSSSPSTRRRAGAGRNRDESPGQPVERPGLQGDGGSRSAKIAARLAVGYTLDEILQRP